MTTKSQNKIMARQLKAFKASQGDAFKAVEWLNNMARVHPASADDKGTNPWLAEIVGLGLGPVENSKT